MMNQFGFEKKLNELVEKSDGLPSPQKAKILILARKSRQLQNELADKIQALQNSLDYLRLGVKYLVFDLEATRRENKALRKRLEESQQE